MTLVSSAIDTTRSSSTMVYDELDFNLDTLVEEQPTVSEMLSNAYSTWFTEFTAQQSRHDTRQAMGKYHYPYNTTRNIYMSEVQTSPESPETFVCNHFDHDGNLWGLFEISGMVGLKFGTLGKSVSAVMASSSIRRPTPLQGRCHAQCCQKFVTYNPTNNYYSVTVLIQKTIKTVTVLNVTHETVTWEVFVWKDFLPRNQAEHSQCSAALPRGCFCSRGVALTTPFLGLLAVKRHPGVEFWELLR
eukprot:3594241-Amphidinium_carterae.1